MSLIFCSLSGWSQVPDSLQEQGPRWRLYSIGAAYMDGVMNYLNSYNSDVLIINSRLGLPIYSDWGQYESRALMPEYNQYNLHLSMVDTLRLMRLRFGLGYVNRLDSLFYDSMFAINDTVFRRSSSERSRYLNLSFSVLKSSRKIFKFLRFHAGLNLEVAASPSTDIYFWEASFDVGEERVIEFNQFDVVGKPRLNTNALAVVGMEMIFFHRLGINLEVRSGLGAQLIARESVLGLSKTVWQAGLNYYFWDHPDPKPKPPPEPMEYWPETVPEDSLPPKYRRRDPGPPR